MYIDEKRREKMISFLIKNICIHCYKSKNNPRGIKYYCNECSKKEVVKVSKGKHYRKVLVCPLCKIYTNGKVSKMNKSEVEERKFKDQIIKNYLWKADMYMKGRPKYMKYFIIKTIGRCSYICFECFSKDVDNLLQ